MRTTINMPSYHGKKTTFLLEMEKIAIKEGFPTIKAFVTHYISKGYTYKSLRDYVIEKHNLSVHYETFRTKIKKFAPSTYNIKTVGHYKRRAIATKKGHLRSVNSYLKELLLKGYPLKRIAKNFKTDPGALRRNKYLLTHDLNGNDLFPDKVNLGMKNLESYFRWLKNARKIGFESVVEAIEYLLTETNLSIKDIAWVFQVTEFRMRVRISRCPYLYEKYFLKKEREE